MLWYNDNKNTIVFQGEGYTRGTPEYDYKLEWQRMRTVVDSCYREGRDPFVILTAYCASDLTAKIDVGNQDGLFYGIDRFFGDLQRCNSFPKGEEFDLCIMHWIVDCYATARETLHLKYKDIVEKWPVKDLYRWYSPLHETSERNALEKLQVERDEILWCTINTNSYLRPKEVPEDLKYLLAKKDSAKHMSGIFDCTTVFFHRVEEENGYYSNWYLSDFELEGHTFCCVEQWMMWKKACMFGDRETAQEILDCTDPAIMKKLGRSVKGYVDSRWAAERFYIVREGVRAKFEQNAELKEKMMQTTGAFAEAAPNDRVWGIGMSADDPRRFNKANWNGQNLLGAALSDVYWGWRKIWQ